MNILKVVVYAILFALIWINAVLVDVTKSIEFGHINNINDVNGIIVVTFIASLIITWQAFEATKA